MVTQEERNAIAELYGEDDVMGTLESLLMETLQSDLDKAIQNYRKERALMFAKRENGQRGIMSYYALNARDMWSEASKRVKELEKEVCK